MWRFIELLYIILFFLLIVKEYFTALIIVGFISLCVGGIYFFYRIGIFIYAVIKSNTELERLINKNEKVDEILYPFDND